MGNERGDGAILRVGVIGAGSMGSRHARVVAAHPDAELTVVVDRSAPRAAGAPRHSASWSTDISSLRRCDAVIVATPTSTHLDIASELLSRGTPVLIEKPAAFTLDGVDTLLGLAADTCRPTDVRLHRASQCRLAHRSRRAQRRTVRLSSTRRSRPVARSEGDVAIDLMIHDIDLAVAIFGCEPAPCGPELNGAPRPEHRRTRHQLARRCASVVRGQPRRRVTRSAR